MKKFLCLLCLSLAFTVCACSSEEEEVTLEIVANDVYEEPSNPTDAQIELYNALSEALSDEDGGEQTIAELVAQNFVFDFYSLKTKESSADVGGLTYLPEDIQDDFATYATSYVYCNYATIVSEYGEDSLPMVTAVTVTNTETSTYEYTVYEDADSDESESASSTTETYESYVISVEIEYADTDLSEDEMKFSAEITVINIDGRLCVVALS